MSYTAKQWRAINWLVERDKLRPQISAFPLIRALRPDDTVFEEHITDVVAWYDGSRARDKRAKQEVTKTAKRKAGA